MTGSAATGAIPGIQIDTSRKLTNGNLGTLPVLLSGSDLGPPAINLTRSYPMAVQWRYRKVFGSVLQYVFHYVFQLKLFVI